MKRIHIKLIACVTMLIDHICFAFFNGNATAHMIRLTVGRIAFPLFAFMIVRGFLYTRSRLKYALSMLVTAVISEFIYDRLFYRRRIYWANQNIIFLLVLCLGMLCLLEMIGKKELDLTFTLILQFAAIAGFCAAAYFLKLDYSIWGVMVIAVFYFTRNERFWFSCGAAVIPLALDCNTYGAFLAVIPMIFYKEKGGKLGTFGKYAFYAFYPGHLALLLALKHLV